MWPPIIAPLNLSVLFCAAFLCNVSPLHAEEETDNGFISLQIENDLFSSATNTDRHYTNGLQAAWLSAPQDHLPEWLQSISELPLIGLFTDDANVVSTTHRVGVGLGQDIFTPDNTDIAAPIPTDRPYAAWLHTTLTLQSVRRNIKDEAWQDQWKLDLGVVGPAALGRQVQNGWHKLIGANEPKGWANQLKNEPGINLSFERAWRSRSFGRGSIIGLETDAIPYGIAAIGNVQTFAGGGVTFRIGPHLPDDFGPTRIYPGTGGSDWFHASSEFEWYLFAGLEGRAVARDIFLDGNNFRDSASVDKKPFVGDAKIGAVAVLGNTRVSFTHVFRTREFFGQPKPDQFGSITFNFGL